MLKLRLPGPHPLKFPRKGALAFSALGRGGWRIKHPPYTQRRKRAIARRLLTRLVSTGTGRGGLRWLPGRALGNRSAQRPWHAVTGAGRERVETEERNVQTEMGGRGPGRNGKLGPRGLRRRVRSSRRRVTRTRCQVARFSPRLLARPVSSPPSRFSKAGPRPE